MAVTYDSGDDHAGQPSGQFVRDLVHDASWPRPSRRPRPTGIARVVVVRSASEKFFSAGADIKRFLANDVDANMEMIRLAHEALASIARSRKLFVACIAGHALGGGLEIPLACDVRYAIEGRYRLGTPEVTLGILPGNGGTQRLPRLIGVGPALELLTTGRQISPDEALRLGLVSQVFADQAAFDEHIAGLRALPPLALDQHQASGVRGR